MTAQVFIITAQAKNVLRVPLAALGEQQSDKRYRVVVSQNGGSKGQKTTVRWVLLGLRNDQYAEVKEGL
jgi:macrolide-specific efflux system membrane fusion protein